MLPACAYGISLSPCANVVQTNRAHRHFRKANVGPMRLHFHRMTRGKYWQFEAAISGLEPFNLNLKPVDGAERGAGVECNECVASQALIPPIP